MRDLIFPVTGLICVFVDKVSPSFITVGLFFQDVKGQWVCHAARPKCALTAAGTTAPVATKTTSSSYLLVCCTTGTLTNTRYVYRPLKLVHIFKIVSKATQEVRVSKSHKNS